MLSIALKPIISLPNDTTLARIAHAIDSIETLCPFFWCYRNARIAHAIDSVETLTVVDI